MAHIAEDSLNTQKDEIDEMHSGETMISILGALFVSI